MTGRNFSKLLQHPRIRLEALRQFCLPLAIEGETCINFYKVSLLQPGG